MVKSALILLAAAAIALFAIYIGQPLERSVLSAAGIGWPPELADMDSLIGTFGIMLVLALIAGRLTRSNPVAPGPDAAVSTAVGLLLGLALVAVAVAGSFALDNAMIVDRPALTLGPMAIGTLAYLLVAVAEETLFRGWAQPLIARYVGPAAAIVSTSIVFTIAHDVTFQNPPLVSLNLFLGSLVMGMLAVRHGGVAAPIMFHFGWNWADYFLFALTPNPGRFSFGAIFDVDLFGMAQLGGVADGLMANIFATLILLAMAAYLVFQLRATSSGPNQRRTGAPKTEPTPAPAPQPVVAELSDEAEASVQQLTSPPEAQASRLPPEAETILIFGDTGPAEAAGPTVAKSVQTATHQGCVRELNEDRFLAREDSGIFVVADGMGGHKFGDRASTIIVEHVSAVPNVADLESRLAAVADSVRTANGAIHAEAQSNGSRMGSTVVALLIEDRRYAIVWAGDSRAYRFRNGDVQRLTKDHTQVQEMVDRGLLKPEEVARHPMSHVLVRAVGVNPEIELDTIRGEIEAGDVFFLCSDGIYDVLEEDEIAALLAKSSKIDAMEKMISMALDLGARDNVTGIIVRPQSVN